MTITFDQLWQQFPYPNWGTPDRVPISGIAVDNRKVTSGNVFVAMKGYTVDSHQFIPDAISRGAIAVVGADFLTDTPVPYIRVENPRQAVAYLAAAFNGYPGEQLTMIGVTGTDGKTTTSNLLYQILKTAGYKTGMISTVNAVIGDEIIDTGFHVTTPDALEIQKYLALMVQYQLTHCILETTSHGWEQYRTDACELNIGVFTNITHEHLDMHGSYEKYRAAKARLIESVSSTKDKKNGALRVVIINRDEPSYEYLYEMIRKHENVRPVTYGLGEDADITAEQMKLSETGTEFMAKIGSERMKVSSQLVGEFNVLNCLAALAVAVKGLGIQPDVAAEGVGKLAGVKGRMEAVDLGQKFKAIVDFAHTPNALRQALTTARLLGSGEVIAVFGSAGLRDKEKRRLMAAVSCELADVSIFTAEDPRTEPVERILDEMADEAKKKDAIEGENFYVVADRGDAIRKAVQLAKPGDIIMVCGKGHEQSMCFGEIEYPWDDRAALEVALAEQLGIDGYTMPWLPTS